MVSRGWGGMFRTERSPAHTPRPQDARRKQPGGTTSRPRSAPRRATSEDSNESADECPHLFVHLDVQAVGHLVVLWGGQSKRTLLAFSKSVVQEVSHLLPREAAAQFVEEKRVKTERRRETSVQRAGLMHVDE